MLGTRLFQVFDFQDPRISQHSIFEFPWTVSRIIRSILVSPKFKIIGFGSHGNHENEDFSGFPKVRPKSTSSKWSRIILRSFRATLFSKCTVNMPPPRPQKNFAKSLIFLSSNSEDPSNETLKLWEWNFGTLKIWTQLRNFEALKLWNFEMFISI